MKQPKNATKATRVFSESLPIVAAALGSKMGIRIEFGGLPCTDGKTIQLPFLNTCSSDREREVLGLLCHECGHVRFTDLQACRGARTELEKALDNALEDVRIERAMTSIYAGAEAFLRAAHEPVVKTLAASLPADSASLIPLHVLCMTECKLMGRAWLKRLSDSTRQKMSTTFGEQLTDCITALAMKVNQAQSTKDVVAIRKEICAVLHQSAKQAPDSTHVESKAKPKVDEGQQSGQTTSDGHVGTQKGTGNKSSDNVKTAKAIQKALDARQIDNPLDLSRDFSALGTEKERAVANSREPKLDLSGSIRPVQGRPELGTQRLAASRADSVALRHSLLGLVQSKTRTGRFLTDRGRRLSSPHLARLAIGNCQVFEKREERRSPNTAVHVLLDMSGSMGPEGGDLAVRASLGLIQGLQSIRGANPALSVFPGVACGQRPYAVCPILRHGERLERLPAAELGAIQSYGSTPLAQALTHAWIELLRCRQEDRTVFLITDGPYLSNAACQAIDRLTESGIRIFAILISSDNANPLNGKVPRSERIGSIDELKGALYRFAKELLL